MERFSLQCGDSGWRCGTDCLRARHVFLCQRRATRLPCKIVQKQVAQRQALHQTSRSLSTITVFDSRQVKTYKYLSICFRRPDRGVFLPLALVCLDTCTRRVQQNASEQERLLFDPVSFLAQWSDSYVSSKHANLAIGPQNSQTKNRTRPNFLSSPFKRNESESFLSPRVKRAPT